MFTGSEHRALYKSGPYNSVNGRLTIREPSHGLIDGQHSLRKRFGQQANLPGFGVSSKQSVRKRHRIKNINRRCSVQND